MSGDQKSGILDKGKLLAIGAGIGVIAGGLGALLFTPKSGEEVREEIKESVEKLLAELRQKVEEAEEMSKEKYQELVEELVDKYSEVKKLGEDKVGELKEILEEKWEEVVGD